MTVDGFIGKSQPSSVPAPVVIVDIDEAQVLGTVGPLEVMVYRPTDSPTGANVIVKQQLENEDFEYGIIAIPDSARGLTYRSRISVFGVFQDLPEVHVGFSYQDISSGTGSYMYPDDQYTRQDPDGTLGWSDWFVHGTPPDDTPSTEFLGLTVQAPVDGSNNSNTYLVEWEVLVPDELDPNYVYELDKGWSFDGNYIPHFVELNWYFGDNPVDYKGVQKVRVHGLTKGRAFLTVATNGMQTDYLEDYSEAQIMDLPKNPTLVSEEFVPITNYAEPLNRGISYQMKFQGRNTDITLPEPAHVLQVIIPQGTAPLSRAN
jgi:hypothetical protein